MSPPTNDSPRQALTAQQALGQEPPIAADPFANLHKMSTTAGVAEQEYVALNTCAVLAVIFGVAGALSFLGNLFLVISVVGVVFAVIALRQIAVSNGTQTGRALAVGGVVMAVLSGGGAVALRLGQDLGVRRDSLAIGAEINAFGRDILHQDYQAAYVRASRQFRDRVPANYFIAQMRGWQTATRGFQSFRWNEMTPVFKGSTADAMVILGFGDSDQRVMVKMKHEGGYWRITDMPELFPDRTPQPPPAR